jgi:hypothetical protein
MLVECLDAKAEFQETAARLGSVLDQYLVAMGVSLERPFRAISRSISLGAGRWALGSGGCRFMELLD